MAHTADIVEPEQFVFKDDGTYPNSKMPLLVYRQAVKAGEKDPAAIFEQHFAENDWTNSWRDGVYPFAHYHSTSHEVLGIYRGNAKLRLGGKSGKEFEVRTGDVIVIPAGVAHQNLGSSSDFGVVGAYPEGRDWDLLKGNPGERPKADQNIAALPPPNNDPLYGARGPLKQLWKST
jgi:uncharacterized protein YjlB